MKHSIHIPYGNSEKHLEVDDKNLLFSVEPPLPPRPSLKEEQDEVRRAISNPIGAPGLDELIQPQRNNPLTPPFIPPHAGGKRGGKGEVAILVDDFTRPTPAYKVMPVVLETLKR